MNQILVTKKLYITPELKRKKKIYKFDFFLSVFLVCILISLCIYASYDRNKGEETSKEILDGFSAKEDTTIAKNNVLIAVLDDDSQTPETDSESSPSKKVTANTTKKEKTADGFTYTTIATINIPKINVQYPILDGETDSEQETESLLKISPTKFWGADPNEVGNFCIVGHNYRNTKFFSKVPTLEKGDVIEITDSAGKTLRYSVYNKYEVVPEDLSCTSQLTDGKKEITLITCTNDSKKRVIVKANVV